MLLLFAVMNSEYDKAEEFFARVISKWILTTSGVRRDLSMENSPSTK